MGHKVGSSEANSQHTIATSPYQPGHSTSKSDTYSNTNKHLPRIPFAPSKDAKPLPPVPHLTPARRRASKPLPAKPLPEAPATATATGAQTKRPDLYLTLFWIAGFCLWFVGIVLLLPVILEREAMPGLNRLLRRWWYDWVRGGRVGVFEKDEI